MWNSKYIVARIQGFLLSSFTEEPKERKRKKLLYKKYGRFELHGNKKIQLFLKLYIKEK